jgi:hypothetical protein
MQHDVDNLLVSVLETMILYKDANLIFSSQFSNMCSVVLFRTRNLGQHFFDISIKNDVNQSLASLINDNY